MAMIQCPECGQSISDKATQCVHCGKKLVEECINEVEKNCLECGATLSESEGSCPACGCPVEIPSEAAPESIQSVEVAGIKVPKKAKKIVIIAVIAIALCVLAAFGMKYAADVNAEKEYIASYNEYIDNLQMAQLLVISGGSDAESLCNLAYSVWSNTIYEERDSETDQYTRPDGYWVEDFNEALSNLYAASATVDTISGIESNQVAVKDLIKTIQDPPEGLDNCYETSSDLYSAYKILTDLAISPSGNLGGFSDKKSNAISDFMDAYEKLDNQMPEKKTGKVG